MGIWKIGGDMKKFALVCFLFLVVSVAVFSQAAPAPPRTALKIGDPAPDFTLTDTQGKSVKLGDFRGKKTVVLAFYVLAFTGG
ncbi:MAG: hypothetical protein C4325_11315 [Blastocatellia bacterium]